MEKAIVLQNAQVDEITALSYHKNAKYDEDSKMNGQTYSLFRYNGKVFTVNDAEGFAAPLVDGKVGQVKLIVSEDGETLSFDSFMTTEKMINRKKSQLELAVIDAEIAAITAPAKTRAAAKAVVTDNIPS